MPLLSHMIRMRAVTGSTQGDVIDGWVAGRQGGRWAQQKIAAAMPGPRPPRPPARQADPAALKSLAELHERGVLTDAELETLRGRYSEGAQ